MKKHFLYKIRNHKKKAKFKKPNIRIHLKKIKPNTILLVI